MMMKISLIPVCYNSGRNIESTLRSVIQQKYKNTEYIVIDGGSTDGTVEILQKYSNKVNVIVSEPDKGIYDAMNKGIQFATGDIVGTLNSDDIFCDDMVLSRVAKAFDDGKTDAVYGDVKYIDPHNDKRIIRYYSSKNFKLKHIKFGFMIAHPSFYIRKEFFYKHGYYKEKYTISGDFELLIRFLYTHRINAIYLPFPFVNMSMGGISTSSLKSKIILNNENIQACLENGIKTNLLFMYLKYFVKIFEYIRVFKK
jgi:glycosyltransferase involved in cell wall biosynthesis